MDESELLLLPQRYEFSSKSQLFFSDINPLLVVVATTKVRIFKQITTISRLRTALSGCCCYRKGTNFQANHNPKTTSPIKPQLLLLPQRYEFSSKSQLPSVEFGYVGVVVATAKVRIFKQITTCACVVQTV